MSTSKSKPSIGVPFKDLVVVDMSRASGAAAILSHLIQVNARAVKFSNGAPSQGLLIALGKNRIKVLTDESIELAAKKKTEQAEKRRDANRVRSQERTAARQEEKRLEREEELASARAAAANVTQVIDLERMTDVATIVAFLQRRGCRSVRFEKREPTEAMVAALARAGVRVER